MSNSAWRKQDVVVPIARTRSLCLLLADRPMPAAVIAVTGAGAMLETAARPDLGRRVTLRHPRAGTVEGRVAAHEANGIRLDLDRDETAVAFALAVMAAGYGA